jgi:hypothetical protein
MMAIPEAACLVLKLRVYAFILIGMRIAARFYRLAAWIPGYPYPFKQKQVYGSTAVTYFNPALNS